MKLNCLFFPCLAQGSLSYLVFFFFLDLAACFPSAQCLSTQRISQYPLHSPRDPLSATFYCSITCTPRNRCQGTFSTRWPCQGPFPFFLQTQTSGKVMTCKRHLEYGVDPLAGFWMLNSEAFSHSHRALATQFAWNALPRLPTANMSFRAQLRWNFLQKNVSDLCASYWVRCSLCVAMAPLYHVALATFSF